MCYCFSRMCYSTKEWRFSWTSQYGYPTKTLSGKQCLHAIAMKRCYNDNDSDYDASNEEEEEEDDRSIKRRKLKLNVMVREIMQTLKTTCRRCYHWHRTLRYPSPLTSHQRNIEMHNLSFDTNESTNVYEVLQMDWSLLNVTKLMWLMWPN